MRYSAPRIGQQLREDKAIALVRQQSIHGGLFAVSVALCIWLPTTTGAARRPDWLAQPESPELTLVLDLIRNSAPFVSKPV